jgi:hypothetical protein
MRSLHIRQENPTQNSASTDVFHAPSSIQIPNNFYNIAETDLREQSFSYIESQHHNMYNY